MNKIKTKIAEILKISITKAIPNKVDHDEEVDWAKIDLDKANFILQESEKMMRTVSENYDSVANNTGSLRNFLATSLTALFCILQFGDSSYQGVLIVLMVGFCLAFVILSIACKSTSFPTIGSKPEHLIKAKHNQGDFCYLICCQFQSYTPRIALGLKVNSTKGRLINLAQAIISVSFILAVILAVIIFLKP